jgi:hypothetical protein
MIADRFDSRTMANMEVALERACSALQSGQDHAARRYVAKKILQCARKGNVTLTALTEAGQTAARELPATSGRREEAGTGKPCRNLAEIP